MLRTSRWLRLNDKLAAVMDTHFGLLAQCVDSYTTLGYYCNLVTSKATFANIEGGRYVSTETICANKQGIGSFGSTREEERVTRFVVGDTLIGNIRPYFKKIYYSTTVGGCNGDVLCMRPKDKMYAPLVFAAMYQDAFFDYVMSGSKGTKMPRGDKQHIMQYPVPAFEMAQIEEFYRLSQPAHDLQTANEAEITALQAMRAAMLTTMAAC